MDHLNWAINHLNENGYKVHISSPDIIQNTPWSKVYRITTNRGFVFLKIVPLNLSIEPTIIKILQEQFQAHVPILIATNPELHCFLMQDAGIQLHHYLKINFDAKILIQTIHHYTKLQINSIQKIDLFLQMGVPDWRVDKLPNLYHDLIAQENLLIQDGLSKAEIITLKNLETQFHSICEKLSHYNITETFCHADYHDKNILINTHTHQTTIIDLGEVVITHPFFSFLNCLHMAKENFSLSNSQYQQLKIDCFNPWLQFENQEHLFEILALVQQCWSIHAVLGEYRLKTSIDQSDVLELSRQGRLAIKLRQWINQE